MDVVNGQTDSVEVMISGDSQKIIKRGTYKSIVAGFERADNISAPVAKGDKVGTVTFINDDGTLLECDIVAKNDVKEMNFSFAFTQFLYNLF